MTEKEAWAEIGAAYITLHKSKWQCKLTRAGICAAIYVLFDYAMIDDGITNVMKSKAKADRYVHTESFPYRWPPNHNLERALFCFARERECNGQT